MPNEIETLYDTVEAASYLKIGADTLRMKVKNGEIKARRIGSRYYFTAGDINKYLRGVNATADQK